jgi:4-amino-4-deoxy-L-arabinose transferase-like glycosyltransferase
MDGQRKRLAWLIGCLLLGTALRVFRLGHQPLWIDELISLQLATWAHGAEFWRGLLTDIHGPFNSLVLHGWVRGGTGEAWLRLLYVIPAVITIPLAGRLARELFRSVTAGRVAMVAMAISPFHVWYSQEIRSYSWVVLWGTGALLLFVRVLDGRAGRGTWLGLGALLAVGLLTNFSVVFLVAALSVAVVLRRPFSRALLGRWVVLLLGVGLVFLPWFVDWFTRIGGERLFVDAPSPMGMPLRERSGFSPAEVPYALWAFAYGYSLGPPLRALHLDRSLGALVPYLPVLALGGLAAAGVVLAGLDRARREGRLGLLLTLALVPLALSVLLALRDLKTFHPRYLVVFFPAFVALAGAAWDRGGRWARGAVLAAGLLAVVSLGQHYFDPAYAKEDTRSAAQLVLDRGGASDSVVVIYAFRPFRWYYAEKGGGEAKLYHEHKRFLRTDEELRAHVAEASEGVDRVWLVLTRWWDVAPEPKIRRAFEATLDERERWEFPGVKVTLYEGRSA